MMDKSVPQAIWDAMGLPFRLALFPQDWLPNLGWTTLEDERIAAVLPLVCGKLLDVGAGRNTLVRRYGHGVGVDIHDWGGGATLVDNAAQLPFADQSFETVTFVACLNHIPNRGEALIEARRLLRPDGRVVVTMIDPVLGAIGHAIWWYGEDRQRGGMKPGEVGGLWTSDIQALGQRAGFELVHHRRFVYGMNHVYVFKPR